MTASPSASASHGDGQPLETSSDLVEQARLESAGPDVSPDSPRLWAQVRGEINLHNAPELRGDLLKLVEAHQPRKLILNLADVPYMDSSAIAVLVETLKATRRNGGRVYLTQLQDRVAGLLRIARLDSIFHLVQTDDEAREDRAST